MAINKKRWKESKQTAAPGEVVSIRRTTFRETPAGGLGVPHVSLASQQGCAHRSPSTPRGPREETPGLDKGCSPGRPGCACATEHARARGGQRGGPRRGGTRERKRGEQRGRAARGGEGCGALARASWWPEGEVPRRPHRPPLPSRGSRSRGSRLRRPPASGTRSLGGARAPSLHHPPAPPAPAASLATATAHLLPPPPQPPSPPLSSPILAFCRPSGKCCSSEIGSPSGPVRHPPVAPHPRDGFRALGINQAQRRGPLCALGAGELGRNACKRCTHAGECVCLWVLGSAPSVPRKRGGGRLCQQGGARMAVT